MPTISNVNINLDLQNMVGHYLGEYSCLIGFVFLTIYVKRNLIFITLTREVYSCTCKGYNQCSLCFLVGKEEDEEMMDFSRHYTGIVIGVACAAIFAILSIITFSHTRRRLQERHHGSLTNSSRRHVSFSDNDIFQQNAPPTYDDGKLSFLLHFLCTKVLEHHRVAMCATNYTFDLGSLACNTCREIHIPDNLN